MKPVVFRRVSVGMYALDAFFTSELVSEPPSYTAGSAGHFGERGSPAERWAGNSKSFAVKSLPCLCTHLRPEMADPVVLRSLWFLRWIRGPETMARYK